MSFRDSVEKYAKAGHRAEYHWWTQEDALLLLDSITAQLVDAGTKSRFCIRPGLKDDGTVTLWLYVGDENGEAVQSATEGPGGPGDNSNPCPPFCG